MELGFHRELDTPVLHVSTLAFRTVFVTLLPTAVEKPFSEVHKLLGTGGVPTSLTLLF